MFLIGIVRPGNGRAGRTWEKGMRSKMGPAEMRAGNGIVRQCGPEMGPCGNAGRNGTVRQCRPEMGPAEVRAGNGGQGENLRLKPGDRGVRMRPRIAGASWMTGL